MVYGYTMLTHQSGLVGCVKSQVGLLHEPCTVEQSCSQCNVLLDDQPPLGQIHSPPPGYIRTWKLLTTEQLVGTILPAPEVICALGYFWHSRMQTASTIQLLDGFSGTEAPERKHL